mgnify:CR=1 FL=1
MSQFSSQEDIEEKFFTKDGWPPNASLMRHWFMNEAAKPGKTEIAIIEKERAVMAWKKSQIYRTDGL